MSQMGLISNEKICEALGKGVKLPALPTVSQELLQISQQPIDKIDTAHLATIIERDQALTAAILRLVNSPYYGRVGTINNIGRALTIIGIEDSINYLNYSTLRKMVPAFSPLPHLSPDTYFLHSWATATAARMLGRPQYYIQSLPGELYLAGLMHDLGKVVFAEHVPGEFAEALQRSHAEGRPLQDVEFEIIGLDHAALGAHVLESWNLPKPVLDAVAFHHAPGLAPEEHQELAGLTQLANMIASNTMIGDGGNVEPCDIMQSWIHLHGKTRLSDKVQLGALAAEIDQNLREQAKLLFQIESAEAEAGQPASEQEKGEVTTQLATLEAAYAGGEASAAREIISASNGTHQQEQAAEEPQKGMWGRLRKLFHF